MRVGRVAGLAAVLALTCAPAAVAQQTASAGNAVVRGAVTDSVTGAAVVGATVTFEHSQRTVFTDERGTFSIKLPEGPDAMTVQQLGYHDAHLAMAIDSGMAPRSVRLAPDPVMLKGIAVINSRLSSSALAITMSVRSFDARDLARSAGWSASQFLNSRGSLTAMPCPRGAWSSVCVWSRGQVVEPRVWLDDYRLFGGIEELASLPIQDIYRIDVYQRGLYIHVITKWWMEHAARSGFGFSPFF